ncbi:MAG: flagellar biosynthesis protein FlhB [Lacipirellulaceae bacterium]
MAESSGEKSFDATPYRRQQAREKGQVPYSQDLGSAVLLLAGAGVLQLFGGAVATAIAGIFRRFLESPFDLLADRSTLYALGGELSLQLLFSVAPVLFSLMLAAVVVSVAQVGFLFVPDKLQPDWGRVNPLQGFQRLFSAQGVARLGFGLFKVMVVAVVGAAVLWRRASQVIESAELEIGALAKLLVDSSFEVTYWIGGALLILALGDYLFQFWKHEQDLKMTSQEIKEEMRNMQGDPEIQARRRQVQRQMAMARIGTAVPKADVVVTNPTELAVALRYDPATMAAPVVLAKGAGVLAQRIRRLALEAGVPIVERKPLAQLLYKEVNINRPVPVDSYAAVAEVLAYVYQLKGKKPPAPPRAA